MEWTCEKNRTRKVTEGKIDWKINGRRPKENS